MVTTQPQDSPDPSACESLAARPEGGRGQYPHERDTLCYSERNGPDADP